MSALAVTLARFGLLILLWLFVFFALATIRNDVYGGKLPVKKKKAGAKASHSGNSVANTQNGQQAKVTLGSEPSKPKLHVIQGSLAGTTLTVGNAPINVGRSPDSSLVLDDSYASARHARFYLQNGQVILEDLNSTNGTWVNNQQVHEPVVLTPGARIAIGKTILELSQ